MQKGDLVIIKSDRIWPYDIDRNLNAGEIGLVESVSGNSITLGANLKDGYTALENVTITFYRPTKFECENVEFKRKVRENKASVAIRRCNEPKLRNVTVRDSALSGINISQCYLANISQIYLYDNYVDGTGTGYGLQDNSSLGTQIRGLVAKGNRRAVDFSGSIPSKLGSVDGFYVIGIDNAGSCLGTHGTADGIVFRNGICDGGLAGLQIRSPSSTVENVKFVNTESRCIILSYTMSLSVVNCEAQPLIHGSTVGSIAATPARFIEILDLPDDLPSSEVLTFKGNHGTVRQTVLRFLPSANDGIKYLHATNNDITIRTNSSGNDLSFIDSISPAFLSESIIKNNNITLGILGVSNKLIGNNISISTTSSLIIQKVKLEDSDFVKWAGNGSLSNVAVNVTKQSNGKTAKVRGRISFTVTGSTTGSKVRLENIFQNAEDGNVYQKVTGKKDSSFDDFLITKIEQKDLYFSSDTSAFDTPFTDGDYSIDFDITYPLRFTFENSL